MTAKGDQQPEAEGGRRQPSQMDDTERRIRAAMMLGGVDSFSELASRIGSRNFGATTLRKLNDSANAPAKRAIAHACGLPYEFFTVDLQLLEHLPTEPSDADALEGPELVKRHDLEATLQDVLHRLQRLEERRSEGEEQAA